MEVKRDGVTISVQSKLPWGYIVVVFFLTALLVLFVVSMAMAPVFEAQKAMCQQVAREHPDQIAKMPEGCW